MGQIAEATELLDQGNTAEAVALLRAAWDESNKLLDITLAYAGALIEANRLDDAEEVLNEVRLVDRAVHEQLMAQIELKREAGKSPEIEALEKELAADEGNHGVREARCSAIRSVAFSRCAGASSRGFTV